MRASLSVRSAGKETYASASNQFNKEVHAKTKTHKISLRTMFNIATTANIIIQDNKDKRVQQMPLCPGQENVVFLYCDVQEGRESLPGLNSALVFGWSTL